MKLIAIHKVGIGKPAQSGALSYVEPGKPFEIDDDRAGALIDSGAARLPDEDETAKTGGVVEAAKVDDVVASPDPAPLDPETEFDVLKTQAEALGLKVRKGTKVATLREKIREAREADQASTGEETENLL